MQINLACVHSFCHTPTVKKDMQKSGQENFNFIQKQMT